MSRVNHPAMVYICLTASEFWQKVFGNRVDNTKHNCIIKASQGRKEMDKIISTAFIVSVAFGIAIYIMSNACKVLAEINSMLDALK